MTFEVNPLTSLNQLPNLGPVIIQKLFQADIQSAEQLRTVGSTKAFLAIERHDPSACLSMLYALEGAVEGIRWHSLDSEKKRELKRFFQNKKH